MKIKTQSMLMNYVIALMNDEGISGIHVTDVIPGRAGRLAQNDWIQFVKLDQTVVTILASEGITYERLTGWFRKI